MEANRGTKRIGVSKNCYDFFLSFSGKTRNSKIIATNRRIGNGTSREKALKMRSNFPRKISALGLSSSSIQDGHRGMVLRVREIEVKDRQISLRRERRISRGILHILTRKSSTGYYRRDLSPVRIFFALCPRFLVDRHPGRFEKLGTHVENHDHRYRGQAQRYDRGYHDQGDVQVNWSRLNVCSNVYTLYILSSDVTINRVLEKIKELFCS